MIYTITRYLPLDARREAANHTYGRPVGHLGNPRLFARDAHGYCPLGVVMYEMERITGDAPEVTATRMRSGLCPEMVALALVGFPSAA